MIHEPPTGRRCGKKTKDNMAEANDNYQASSLGLISEDTLHNTLAQVSHGLQEEDVPAHNDSTGTTVSNDVNAEDNVEPVLSGKTVNNLFKTLNGIASRFDSFERQSRLDRDRVNKLCEQFSGEYVNKKGKQSKKNNTNVVNTGTVVCDHEDVYRGTGARPKTAGERATQPQTSTFNQPLLTYEQFLELHQEKTRGQDRDMADPPNRQPIKAGSNGANARLSVFRDTEGDHRNTTQTRGGRPGEDTASSLFRRDRVAEQPDVEPQIEEDFPPLQTLHASATIQRQVQDRYKELEDASVNQKGTLENIIEYFTKNSEKKSKDASKGMWPQDHVHVGIDRRKPTYDQLDECQWVLGFLRQRQIAKSSIVKENMIEYLIDVLQDAVDFSFPVAKGAHFVLTHRMIDGLVSWEDLDSVQKIRERYAKSTTAGNKQQKVDTKKLKPVPCFRYNRKSGCSESHDHAYQHLLLKHSCQSCYQNTGNFISHARQNCPRNLHHTSKNA